MNYLFDYDSQSQSIMKSDTTGGGRTVFASNWRNVHAMTMHNGFLLIAADTSIYSMNPQDASFTTVTQNWSLIRALVSDGQFLYILVENASNGGWYRFDVANKKHDQIYRANIFNAASAIWVSQSSQAAGHGASSSSVLQGQASKTSSDGYYGLSERVGCLWNNNAYYMATILAYLGNETYDIVYDDGTKSRTKFSDMLPCLNAKSMQVGQPVMAVWKSQGQLYGGKIAAINDETAIVNWDDGTAGTPVSWQDIVEKPSSKYGVGKRVASLWSGSDYYMAVIREDFGNKKYRILYDDGTNSEANESQFLPLLKPEMYKEGIKVLAVWQSKGKLYAGKIQEVYSHGALVKWYDGSAPSEARWDSIVLHPD